MIRYHLARAVFKAAQLSLANLVITGKTNIPAQGPYLVTLNHMSTADTPLLLVGFPPTEWRFFAGEKWRDHWLWGPLMSWLGGIYINRDEVDRRAIKEALREISEGKVFGIAPEGQRSKNGSMAPAKDGAAYLASRSGAPILPVGIINSDIVFGSARRGRRVTVELRIGKPYNLPDLDRRARNEDLAAYTELIMVHIAALLPERYHGVYAGRPALEALLAGQDPWPYCTAAGQHNRDE